MRRDEATGGSGMPGGSPVSLLDSLGRSYRLLLVLLHGDIEQESRGRQSASSGSIRQALRGGAMSLWRRARVRQDIVCEVPCG